MVLTLYFVLIWCVKLCYVKGLADLNKPPEMLSGNMTSGLAPLLPWNVDSFFLVYDDLWLISSHACFSCCSNVCLFSLVHEICMDGSATKLSTSCVPCLQWDSSTLSFHPLGKVTGVSCFDFNQFYLPWLPGHWMTVFWSVGLQRFLQVTSLLKA